MRRKHKRERIPQTKKLRIETAIQIEEDPPTCITRRRQTKRVRFAEQIEEIQYHKNTIETTRQSKRPQKKVQAIRKRPKKRPQKKVQIEMTRQLKRPPKKIQAIQKRPTKRPQKNTQAIRKRPTKRP